MFVAKTSLGVLANHIANKPEVLLMTLLNVFHSAYGAVIVLRAMY